jgi:hypothetical protein
MSRFQLVQGFFHRGQLRVPVDTRTECGGDILGTAMHTLHILQQADHLRDRLRQRMAQLLVNGGNLRADLRANVPFDKIVNLIKADELADLGISKVHGRVDQQLLGELDYRAVRAADMLARAALRSEARDHLDDEVYLVRKQRIQVDEVFARQLRKADVGSEPRVLG